MSSATLERAATNVSGYVPEVLAQSTAVTPPPFSKASLHFASLAGATGDVVHRSPRAALLIGPLAPYAQGWYVFHPLPLDIEVDSSLYVVSDSVFDVYGVGDSPVQALRDYVISLTELYQIVEDDVRAGVPHTQEEFARLGYFLRRQ